jgi:peptide subunit release factor 1 (eRF1)
VLSKVGTGLVHARHKKGGSSQRRFQRRQDNEVDAFIERACGHVRERLEPRAKEIDYLVYGGGREAILLLRKECQFLHQFDTRLLPPLLDIPSPRKVVLEAAVSRIWSSSVIEWHET